MRRRPQFIFKLYLKYYFISSNDFIQKAKDYVPYASVSSRYRCNTRSFMYQFSCLSLMEIAHLRQLVPTTIGSHRMYAATLHRSFFRSDIIIITYIKAAVLFIFLVAVIRNEDVVFAVQKRLISTVHSVMASDRFCSVSCNNPLPIGCFYENLE